MTTINATMLRNNLSDAINEITEKKDYMLISKRGKITSALVDIDLFEDLMELSNSEYVASIKKAREEKKSGDVFSHEEVFGDL